MRKCIRCKGWWILRALVASARMPLHGVPYHAGGLGGPAAGHKVMDAIDKECATRIVDGTSRREAQATNPY
eukprot:50432-Eustigmatos_ZCMA.PRE.1